MSIYERENCMKLRQLFQQDITTKIGEKMVTGKKWSQGKNSSIMGKKWSLGKKRYREKKGTGKFVPQPKRIKFLGNIPNIVVPKNVLV
jgi:hypothetical protein